MYDREEWKMLAEESEGRVPKILASVKLECTDVVRVVEDLDYVLDATSYTIQILNSGDECAIDQYEISYRSSLRKLGNMLIKAADRAGKKKKLKK